MADIGYECFVNEAGKRIRGVFKQQVQDFHVREVTRDGGICQLTSLLSSDSIRQEHLQTLERDAGFGQVTEDYRLPEEIRRGLSGFMKERDIESLETFIRAVGRYRVVADRFPYHGGRRKRQQDERKRDVQSAETAADDNANDVDQTETVITEEVDPAERERRVKEGDDIRGWLLSMQGILVLDAFSETPDSGENVDAKLMKEKRKHLHDFIRQNLPFLITDTCATGELYESQKRPAAKLCSDIKGEILEAASCRVLYEPSELLRKMAFEPFDSRCIMDIAPELNELAASMSAEPAAADKYKFFRLKIKPALAFRLTGRPLGQVPSNRDSATRWTNALPPYLHFTMLKTNRDSNDAITSLCKGMGIKPKLLSVAGSKDKRAVTVQRVCLERCTIPRLLQATTYRNWDQGIKIGDLNYAAKRLRLGDLEGNHFRFAIRHVPLEQLKGDQISQLVDSIKDKGFINYFGNQRFGTSHVPTWRIGVALIQQNWEEAVNLIFGSKIVTAAARKPTSNNFKRRRFDNPIATVDSADAVEDTPAEAQADNKGKGEDDDREIVDWRATAKRLRHWEKIEKALVDSLIPYPTDFMRALQQLHKNTLSMYCHAVQSLVWNQAVSERMKRGYQVQVGDLVLIEDQTNGKENTKDNAKDNAEDNVEEVGDEDEEPEEASTGRIKQVDTEEEASQYDVTQLVLPLFGEGAVYPPNMLQFYKERVELLIPGVTLSDLEDGRQHRVTKVIGLPRKVVVKPRDVHYRVVDHPVDDSTSLLASDLDRLLNREIASTDDFTDGLKPIAPQANHDRVHTAGESRDNKNCKDANEAADTETPREGAVLFSCTLPRGSYLTCLLRELLDAESIDAICAKRA